MQSLSHFGDILQRPKNSANAFRGDLLEGTIAVTGTSGPGATFIKDAFGEGFPKDGHIVWTSESMRQRRIYSFYCLEYSTEDSNFVAPDTRVNEFGDTAVLIIHPIEFFARLRRCLSESSIGLDSCAAKRVDYAIDTSSCGSYDEFHKNRDYIWQNEYRLSIDLSLGRMDRQAWQNMSDFAKIMFLNQGGELDLASFEIDFSEGDMRISEWETMSNLDKIRFLAGRSHEDTNYVTREPLVLQLGSLRDICVSVSTDDLLALNVPFNKFGHSPYVVPPLYRR